MDVDAKAALGVLIARNKLWLKSTMPGCDHRPGRGSFCPDCGEPAFVSTEVPLVGYDSENDKFGEFNVVWVTDEAALICRSHASAYWNDRTVKIPADADPNLKEELKKALEPAGIWDEEKFGLWAAWCCFA